MTLIEDPELLAAREDYLEIRLTDRGITENARDILRRRFPHLLSLRQDEALAGLASALANKASASREGSLGERRDMGRRSVSQDFRDFLLSLYEEANQSELSAELSAEMELFNSLLEETEAEELSL